MSNRLQKLLATVTFFNYLPLCYGDLSAPQMQQCILNAFQNSQLDRSIYSIQTECKANLALTRTNTRHLVTATGNTTKDKSEANNNYTITPHRLNFIQPILSSSQINRGAYESIEDWSQNLRNLESKYQFSVKAPIKQGLFTDTDSLNTALTVTAWWQSYTAEISRPIRETNYRPELFYHLPLQTKWAGYSSSIQIGIEHFSNGRDVPLSRSINRVFSELRLSKDSHQFYLRPWYRLPTPDQNQATQGQSINDTIDDFFGYFEAGGAIQYKHHIEFYYNLRGNPKTTKGATELAMSFPFWGKLRGYTSVFHGYGESLIDFNHNQTRVGLGFVFNRVL